MTANISIVFLIAWRMLVVGGRYLSNQVAEDGCVGGRVNRMLREGQVSWQ